MSNTSTVQWIKTDGAAARTGLSVDSIREALKRGDLKGYRPGGGTRGHFLIAVDDLDAWVMGSPVFRAELSPDQTEAW